MSAEEPRRLSDRERVNLLLDEVARLQAHAARLEAQVATLTSASFALMTDHGRNLLVSED